MSLVRTARTVRPIVYVKPEKGNDMKKSPQTGKTPPVV